MAIPGGEAGLRPLTALLSEAAFPGLQTVQGVAREPASPGAWHRQALDSVPEGVRLEWRATAGQDTGRPGADGL